MVPAAHAVIDIEAIRHNLDCVRRRAPQAKIMAVIKANAYGHGMVRIAKALEDADAFAVARVDEGVSLREAGIANRIAVLQGFTNEPELVLHARHDLEPVIHSPVQVDMLSRLPLIRPVSVWLKLDSGMHRLGLTDEQFIQCFERLAKLESVRAPIAMMTHLANADVLGDPVTPRQLETFWQRVSTLPGERSLANSAGLLAWERALADWVRPGIVLYGVSPFPQGTANDCDLRPVMTLKSRIIAIKDLTIGDAVGYGGEWVCDHPTRMGVVAVGYGDGYPRHARSGTPVLIHSRRVPLIGRVSMDMITVDLTDCPNAIVGDEAILWGRGLPVEEIARYADTIPYELLCGVTSRVRIVENGAQSKA